MHLSHISRPKRVQAVRQQAGYTIVELSIAVAIAGVLLVSAIGLVQNVLQTNRANETVTILARVMAQIDKVWAEQPGYAGITLDTVAATGAFTGMQLGTALVGGNNVTTVTSRFNRPVYLALAPDIPAAGLSRGYSITFAGVPRGVCADLVTAASSVGVSGIMVTPEANATAAALVPTGLNAAGVLAPPAGTVVVRDGSSVNVNLPVALGATACGTAQATVALTFVNWK